MVRGTRAADLPQGIRQDARKHTRHILRPTAQMVKCVLSAADAAAFQHFATEYRELLGARFAAEPTRFDDLAALATIHHVYVGCSCPTRTNPDVLRCHTTLALAFMKERYPELDVLFPAAT